MKAILIDKTVQLVDVGNDRDALQAAVRGRTELVWLEDGASMIVNEDAAANGLQQNAIASLIARKIIYGPALIVGVDRDETFADVSEGYVVLLGLQNT